jgi:hypothetical protein
MAKLNSGPAHQESQSSGKFPSNVVVSGFTPAPRSNSNTDTYPGTTDTDKDVVLDLGNPPADCAEKPDGIYGF